MSLRYILSMLILLSACTASADLILHDHFDDGVLDPAWVVEFGEHACGWTAVEEGSSLTVSEICHDGPTLEWATVTLAQPCLLPNDFNVAWRMTWDSLNNLGTMQYLYLYLRDSDGGMVAVCGYSDPWAQYAGQIYANVAGHEGYGSGASMLFSGSVLFIMNRENGLITCKCDTTIIFEASDSTEVASVEISFARNRYANELICESVGLVRCYDNAAIAPVDDLELPQMPRMVNYPNPFNPQTQIAFTLDWDTHATLSVYDLNGELVNILAERSYGVGEHIELWNGQNIWGRDMPSGTYILRLDAGQSQQTRKIQLIR